MNLFKQVAYVNSMQEKQFFIRDLSGRGYHCITKSLKECSLYADDEFKEWSRECEIGDKWEGMSDEYIRVK